jgi:hypothetical protein
MRPSLRTITEHSHPRRPRDRRTAPRKRAATERATALVQPPASAQPVSPPNSERLRRDPAAQRVRAEGGPLDRASYSCQCGYLFEAPVTTTVECPNCAAHQAW